MKSSLVCVHISGRIGELFFFQIESIIQSFVYIWLNYNASFSKYSKIMWDWELKKIIIDFVMMAFMCEVFSDLEVNVSLEPTNQVKSIWYYKKCVSYDFFQFFYYLSK